MDKQNNIGRFQVVKKAFIEHISQAVSTIYPATKALKIYNGREMKYRLMVAEDRMVDKVEQMLEAYQKKGKSEMYGLDNPLPVILIAFAKDTNPIANDRGLPVAQEQMIGLDGRYYKMRFAHLENRVQLCFLAYEDETARAMTTQIRLWLQKFQRRFFPIQWHFENHDFELAGSIEDVDIVDEVADLEERVNLTVLLWNITLNFQMPYVEGSGELDVDGFDIGFGNIKKVHIDVQDETRDNKGLHLFGEITADKEDWGANHVDNP